MTTYDWRPFLDEWSRAILDSLFVADERGSLCEKTLAALPISLSDSLVSVDS
jgi:hypothetical protein